MENEDWATGPPGRQAAGPSWAVGCGAVGHGPAFSKTPQGVLLIANTSGPVNLADRRENVSSHSLSTHIAQ